MDDSAARLLTMLSLLQSPLTRSGAELAGRLAVSGRTVRRDIERLRSLGYPVEAGRGPDGGYRLGAGSAMPPLLLEDDEAVALAVGLRTAALQPITGLEDASLRALGKVMQVLPARLRPRVAALSHVLPLPETGEGRVDQDVLLTVAAAATNGERARFHYVDHDGNETDRHVEPARLVVRRRRWYLIAYDLERDAWRTLRVDRITQPRRTGVRATRRELPGGAVEQFLHLAERAMEPTCRAEITLLLPVADAERRLATVLADGRLEARGSSRCLWHTHSDTPRWLALRLLELGCGFTVHGPPMLIDELRHISRRLAAGTPTRETAPQPARGVTPEGDSRVHADGRAAPTNDSDIDA